MQSLLLMLHLEYVHKPCKRVIAESTATLTIQQPIPVVYTNAWRKLYTLHIYTVQDQTAKTMRSLLFDGLFVCTDTS